ncbi:hypothetical protein [Streptomyces avidinii]
MAGEHGVTEEHHATGERGPAEVHRAPGEHRAAEVHAAVDGDAGEVEVAALPGAVGSSGAAVVVADEPQDGVPDLAQGQVAVVFVPVGGVLSRVGGEGELEVRAQNVDAGLAQAVVGGVVRQAGEGVDAPEPDGRGVRSDPIWSTAWEERSEWSRVASR